MDFDEGELSPILRRPATAHVATFPATFHIDHGTLLLFIAAVSLDRRN
jgi:hypothetical protein